MGGRYGGDIKKTRGGRPFFPVKALARLGRDTRLPFEAIGKETRRLLHAGKKDIPTSSG